MRELTVAEHKQHALGILVKVADFCDKNDITYYLADGTLLGAVRHGGFIPWDDDVDIMMPRPDYERFIKTFKDDTGLKLTTPYDEYPLYSFTKVYDSNTVKIEPVNYRGHEPFGVDIDIFAIDGQPPMSKQKKFVSDYKKRKIINKMILFSRIGEEEKKNSSFVKRVCIFIAGLIGPRALIRKYTKIAAKYDYDTSEIVGSMTISDGLRSRHVKSEVFRDKIKMKFEEYEFWVPVGYDRYLTDKYGDYMTPPPRNEQATHHANNVYIKD